jgi:three-Cys-motif partner protein
MKISRAYEGREHSLIKHELLKGYLEILLCIVGISGVKEFAYVDCFAGPWGDETDLLSGTSISISLEILAKVRKTLADVHNIHGTKFRAIYVEENKKRYKQLSEYLQKNCPNGIDCHPLHGDYSAKQDEILRLCGDKSFAFFFIDPKGWLDVGISRLEKLLKRPKSEFLITFMYDFLNRAVGMTDMRSQVEEMLGTLTDEEYQEISSMRPKDREEFIVRKYRKQLKAAMGLVSSSQPRSYHAVVKDKDRERTKYHLVYVTRHHKGIIKFVEQSAKTDFFQSVVRIQTKQNAKPQRDLSSAEEEAEHLSDERVDLEEVKRYWLKQLSNQPVIFDEAKLADMLEETGWLIKDFQLAFGELLSENKVENLDVKKKRRTVYVHFDEGEQLRRCI